MIAPPLPPATNRLPFQAKIDNDPGLLKTLSLLLEPSVEYINSPSQPTATAWLITQAISSNSSSLANLLYVQIKPSGDA
jgi:hypothetical protein